jgi:MscS family membrane protein
MRTQRKVDVRLELSLATTAQQIQDAIAAIKQIIQHEAIEDSNVYFSDTGLQSHVLTVEYFTNALQDGKAFLALRESVNLQIIQLLESSKIELAARNTDVVIHSLTS